MPSVVKIKMVQYPHMLKTTSGSTDAQYVDGQWVPGEPTEEVLEVCRAEPAGAEGLQTTPDGDRIDYSWVVYFPHSVSRFPLGVSLEIYQDEELIITDTVKKFYRGQLNARVWL